MNNILIGILISLIVLSVVYLIYKRDDQKNKITADLKSLGAKNITFKHKYSRHNDHTYTISFIDPINNSHQVECTIKNNDIRFLEWDVDPKNILS